MNNSFELLTFQELLNQIDIYQYYDQRWVYIFKSVEQFKHMKVALYQKDLHIQSMEEIPKEAEMLVVLGDMVIDNQLIIREFGVSFPDGYDPRLGALIVKGNLHCNSLSLSWGDIVVCKDLVVNDYIHSDYPMYEQGTLHVKGHVHVKHLFIENEYHPNYIFDLDQSILENTHITKMVTSSNEQAFMIENSNMCYTADSYFNYLKGDENHE